MASPGKTLHIRLTDEQFRRFERLHGEFKGLPTVLVLKLLLADQLEKDFDDQVAIVQAQIRGEGSVARRRLPSVSSNNRVQKT